MQPKEDCRLINTVSRVDSEILCVYRVEHWTNNNKTKGGYYVVKVIFATASLYLHPPQIREYGDKTKLGHGYKF